ncbi:SGNH/GDSL hydrolase family protein [Asanoa hainanensis]|uniref:SGNH/GDSL hydrolase family protein n=1 Tax=Asanoa hainanensis TaxID=560556 RepID=UPI001FEC3014|nr:SGNH/GDSL hydrolase family protein [Asanoa hainanensis]
MRPLVAGLCGVTLGLTGVPVPDGAAAKPPAPSPAAPQAIAPDRIADPDRTLGAGWRTSDDRSVVTSGDETGLHVLVADRKAGYRWRTAATLAEPGFETDQWIGNACVTGSGRRAVVVYAPRQFTNDTTLMQRGGFAAVVDLSTGAVSKLAENVSLAYHNPGCGAGETATLSRLEQQKIDAPAATWVGVLDTAKATWVRALRSGGQLTSILPVGADLVGVRGYSLVKLLGDGKVTTLAELSGSPHRLVADGPTGVALQVKDGANVSFHRYVGGRDSIIGSAPSGTVRLRGGGGGRVFAVGGKATQRLSRGLPTTWKAVDAQPDSEVSTTGAFVVTYAATGKEAAGNVKADRPDGQADPVTIAGRLTDGSKLRFSTTPAEDAAGRLPSPTLGGSRAKQPAGRVGALADYSTTTWDPDASCAVWRNDPKIQVFQPSPKQVEWAADLAVRGQLTFQRPANWLNNGMPAYSPQGYFPPLALSGGGQVPAQIMLGIMAQESNHMQASFHAVDGEAGNPLTSLGYYGIESGDRDGAMRIDWSKTDCGYGVGQVTSGMFKADTGRTIAGVVWDANKQKAVALDYATNVSAALRILQDKWNQTRSAGLIANNGAASFLENWWFALWAYNTGFYPRDAGAPNEPWGVGWANNVANQDYPPDRQMFLTAPLDVPAEGDEPAYDDEGGYDNAKHPNHWAYPERVIGFAYTSLRRYNYADEEWQSTYVPADGTHAIQAQPGRFTFCTAANSCDPAAQETPDDYPGTKPGPCLREDLRCWWGGPASWVECATICGVEKRTYTSVEPRPLIESMYPTPTNGDGSCKVDGLPSGARIIDDISTSVAMGSGGCEPTFTKGGSFEFTFGSATGPQGSTIYPAKVDFHQIGAGFGGHFWFAHTMNNESVNRPVKVTGKWTINPTNAWTRVYVHVPDHGAHTGQADYQIYRPGATTPSAHRAIPTRHEANTWLDIGVFDFRGTSSPRIELSNVTQNGSFLHDIAWDAVAVEPLAAKPRHFVVAMGDSYSSGEGNFDYSRVSDQYGEDPANKDACRRSPRAWSRKVVIPNTPGGATLGSLADGHNSAVDFHHVACAGAQTHNLMSTTTLTGAPAPVSQRNKPPAGTQGELTQLDQGFVDANTTLVLLQIGGNDAGWSDVVNACFFNDCLDPSFRFDKEEIPELKNLPLTQLVPRKLHDWVQPDVRRVIREIKERAPNAWIIMPGYPKIFNDGSSVGGEILGQEFLISGDEVTWLNQAAGTAAAELLYSDLPNKINSIDVRADFDGRGVGGLSSLERWLNPIVPGEFPCLLFPDDDGEKCGEYVGEGTMHPNPAGHQGYATAVSSRMGVLPYTW